MESTPFYSTGKLLYIWFTSSNYRKQISAGVALMQRFRANEFVARYFHRKIYQKFNCEIDARAFVDESVEFIHPIGIVIGSGAVINEGVTIFQNVTIGALGRNDVMPNIGKGVTIYAGAKVVGGIDVGEKAIIGANSVVSKSVPARHIVVGANRILPPKEDELAAK